MKIAPPKTKPARIDKNSSGACKDFLAQIIPTTKARHWLLGNARGWSRNGLPQKAKNGDTLRQFDCGGTTAQILYDKTEDKLFLQRIIYTLSSPGEYSSCPLVKFKARISFAPGKVFEKEGRDITQLIDPQNQFQRPKAFDPFEL